ncbi:hypothetical protein EEL32_09380 [Brevibacillus laterosporus]|uniref:Uncharacterized protein n=1 Tax=Brevibacillus laterosporus TaxID=1465 RepID=A0A502IQR9_BRELA|nr:SPOR domain-containing protein [Brevibacillus laterosporus]QDX93334.1 hypothetical protein EEL30_14140 [Brevibacillus laterosporus]RAP23995.1 hypothetical protein C2W64_02955 [Brevibacillus laterosporus]TPG73079.1 hypothetical protein EEL31_01495 [Brevibacillus laterosporus]TPG88364.1 hypothetical protein EEL32_09380 [Brevibacillus laterosporus]
MWVKWVSIHQSYGLPRAAEDYRQRLRLAHIRSRITSKKSGATYVYNLQVPIAEKDRALQVLHTMKKEMQL